MKIKKSQKNMAFAGPSITDREVKYVTDAVKNGWYTTFDKDIKKLEKTIAKYVGVKYALSGFCATHSMHLACLVCGFKKGDEVICTDFSWVATAYVITYTGATPVFVDIDPNTWCISPKAIEKAITPKTKGIMLVHSFGIPCDMDAIMKLAKKHKLKVVEDAAQGIVAKYRGKYLGTIGDFGCLSFHDTKNITCGEGGVLLINSKKVAVHEAAEIMREKGTNRSKFFRGLVDKYTWVNIGSSYLPSDLLAAFLYAQLEQVDKIISLRPYASVEELQTKKAVNSNVFETIKDQVTVL